MVPVQAPSVGPSPRASISAPDAGRQRRLVRGVGANAIAQAINAAGQWLLVPLFLVNWGQHQYGEWLVLTAMTAYVSLFDLGMQTYVVNRLNQCHSRNEALEYATVLHSALAWSVCVSALALTAAALVLPRLPIDAWFRLAEIPRNTATLVALLMAARLLASLPLGILSGLYRTIGEYPRGVMVANVQQAALIGITAAALSGGAGPGSLAVLQLIPLAASVAYVHWDLRRRHPELALGFARAEGKVALSLIGPSSLFLVIQLSYAAALQGSVLILGTLAGAASVAVFVTLRTLSGFIRQGLSAVGHALWPEMTSLEAQGRLETLRDVLLLSSKVQTGLAVGAAVLIHFAGPEIVALWTRGAIRFDSRLLDAFLVLAVTQTPWQVCAALLMSANRHRAVAAVHLASASAGLIAGGLLYDSFGAAGIAYGLLGADVLFCQFFIPSRTCRLIGLEPWHFFRDVLLRGTFVLAAAWFSGWVAMTLTANWPFVPRFLALATAIVSSAAATGWGVGLAEPERRRLRSFILRLA